MLIPFSARPRAISFPIRFAAPVIKAEPFIIKPIL
jgi:hypothetical protein